MICYIRKNQINRRLFPPLSIKTIFRIWTNTRKVSFQREATCLIWKIRYWTKLGKEIRVFHRFRQVEWFAWFHLDRTIGFSTPLPFLLSSSTLITLSPCAQLNYERTEKSESQLKCVFCIAFFPLDRSIERYRVREGSASNWLERGKKSGRNEDAFVRIKSGSLIHPSPSFFCSIWIGKNSLTQFRRRLERVSRRVLPFNCSFKVYQPSPAVRLKRLKRETKLWYSQWSRIQSEGVSFNRTRFLINKRNLCTPLLPRSFSL